MAKKNPSRPYNMMLDKDTRDDIQFIGHHCRSSRSMAAIIRGVVQHHADLLRTQLKQEANKKELVYCAADTNGELQLLGRLNLRKL